MCFPNFLSNYLPIPCINGKQKQKIIRTISLFPVNRKFTGSTNNHLFLLQEKYVREKDRKLTEKVPPEHQPSTNRHEKEEKDRKWQKEWIIENKEKRVSQATKTS